MTLDDEAVGACLACVLCTDVDCDGKGLTSGRSEQMDNE